MSALSLSGSRRARAALPPLEFAPAAEVPTQARPRHEDHRVRNPHLPAAALFTRSGCDVVTDLDARSASLELHEGKREAALQIATAESWWLVIATRPPCVIETVDGTRHLSAGDTLVLPEGMAALLHGRNRGEWIALRFATGDAGPSEAPWLRRMHANAGETLPLVRLALYLRGALRADETALAVAQRRQFAVRLLREATRLRAVRPLRRGRPLRRMTAEQCDERLALLRLRVAAERGDDESAVLDEVLADTRLQRSQLLALYASCFHADPRHGPLKP